MRAIITALFLILFSQSAGAEIMEFQLTDKLDEPRGYCIDIRGHKESAKLDRGLQAHTCYSTNCSNFVSGINGCSSQATLAVELLNGARIMTNNIKIDVFNLSLMPLCVP